MSMKHFKQHSFKQHSIIENRSQVAIFSFGRFNPVTVGHGAVISAADKVQKKTPNSKLYIYASHSQDSQKNPLEYSKKIAYLRAAFPRFKGSITVSNAKNIFEVCSELYKSHDSIILIVASRS